MRAILIDPLAHTVTEVDSTGEWQNIVRHIGAQYMDAVRIGDAQEHTIYVDDEGLINGKAQTGGMFRFDGDNAAYLAGRGLILATDGEGECVAATLTLDDVRKRVAWGRPWRVLTRKGYRAHFVEFVPGLRVWDMDSGERV